MEKEIRMLATDLEIRETDDNKKMMSGYAVKWDQLSEKMGWYYRFREKFKKGSFADSLRDDKQMALWNHNTDMILGNTKNGTLRVLEDDTGLRFENDLPDSEWGKCAHECIKRGDVDGVSFGFKMLGEEWDESDLDNITRTITKAKLFEISPTPFPAYSQSEVQARSLDKVFEEYRAASSTDPGSEEAKAKETLEAQRRELGKVKSKVLKVYEEESTNGRCS